MGSTTPLGETTRTRRSWSQTRPRQSASRRVRPVNAYVAAGVLRDGVDEVSRRMHDDLLRCGGCHLAQGNDRASARVCCVSRDALVEDIPDIGESRNGRSHRESRGYQSGLHPLGPVLAVIVTGPPAATPVAIPSVAGNGRLTIFATVVSSEDQVTAVVTGCVEPSVKCWRTVKSRV